jgi:arylsulfatase A-like enzyme
MERQEQRGASAWGLLVALCIAAPWATRVLLLGEKELAFQYVDLRGAVADFTISLGVIGALGLVLRVKWVGRALAWVLALAFVLLTFAVYEVVSVFDSLAALDHLEYLDDGTFLRGSAFHLRHPVLLGVLALGAAVGALWARPPRRSWWAAWGVTLLGSALVVAVLPISHFYDDWRQQHAVHAQLSVIPASARLGSVGTVAADVARAFQTDLEGERWIDPLEGRPNVLLIMIEGASGASLPSVAEATGAKSPAQLPKLDARAKDHVLLTGVVSHQRQTNRGEYGILCGDYPKLLSDQSKMTEQVYGRTRRCLPAALRDAGYATAYIQAAPLAFMLKDQFMAKAGFDELIGDAWFEQGYARTDWGVDDKAFFEQAIERVAELHSAEQAFFATMLTVGTHHPFTFPAGKEKLSTKERRKAAFAWADDALDEFLSELERRGVLRDTVVIVTSDESAGLVTTASAVERLAAQAWSFAVVMLPEPQAKRIDAVFGHVDTALSIVDLLGLDRESSSFLGRSWFRDYETGRTLYAGNTYVRKVMMLKPSGTSIICDELFHECQRHGQRKSVFRPKSRGRPAKPQERRELADVARLTRSGRAALRPADTMELTTVEEVELPAAEGKRLLAGGQYLRVPAGTSVRVDFDLEAIGREGRLALTQEVFLNGYEKFARKGIGLAAGERWRLSYEIPVPNESNQLVIQLYATTVEGDSLTLRIHEARLAVRKGDASERELNVLQDERSR